MIFVSFYTSFYKKPAMQLRARLEELGYRHYIVRVRDRKDWKKNILRKPAFIWAMLKKFKNETVVWLDADGQILQPPRLLFILNCDLAYHWYRYREPLCNTILLRNTQKMRAFIKAWAKRTRKEGMKIKRPEQQILAKMLPECGLTQYWLPMCFSAVVTKTKPRNEAIIRYRRWGR